MKDLLSTFKTAMLKGEVLLKLNLSQQGHKNTGRLENSIRSDVFVEGGKLKGVIYGLDYAQILNDGVSASRIPFSGRTGRGGTSKYIQGLIQYFRSKGLREQEAKRAAFATANKQKKEGMPTKASFRFSKTGKRTGAVDKTVSELADLIKADLAKGIKDIVTGQVKNAFSGNYSNIKVS